MPVDAGMDGCFCLLYGYLHLRLTVCCMPACLVTLPGRPLLGVSSLWKQIRPKSN